jgi:hypothetical protein
MSILIANLGTSDLAVKVGNSYFPVGFDRQEPNMIEPKQDTSEFIEWNERNDKIHQFSQNSLNIKLSGNRILFREFTERLSNLYQEEPDAWHEQIRPGRIWGVVESALKLKDKNGLQKICFFSTDQPEQEKIGRLTDTIYLFDILKGWFYRQYPEQLGDGLNKIKIVNKSINFSAIDQDKLFDFYYQFLAPFDKNATLLISVKGGTPQMQTALRIQSMSSDFRRQIYLEPKLVVTNILKGNYSECIRISYWQYQRVQKYQMILALLEHWDFNGAVLVLQDWSRNLQSLIDRHVEDSDNKLRKSADCTKYTVLVLEIAIALFNLDIKSAQNKLKELKRFPEPDRLRFLKVFIEEKYDVSHNLYGQCKVYFETGQISNFLARLASFHEFTQIRMIQKLDQNKYFIESNDGYFLKTKLLQNNNKSLWNFFWEDYKLIYKPNECSIPPAHEDLRMGNRLIRKIYLHALVLSLDCNLSKPDHSFWSKLDFWYSKRNTLVHSSKGINKDRVNDVWKNRELKKYNDACEYNSILDIMNEILITLGEADTEHHDLYISIRDAVIIQLNDDLQ